MQVFLNLFLIFQRTFLAKLLEFWILKSEEIYFPVNQSWSACLVHFRLSAFGS